MITAKEARKALSETDRELQKREAADFELAVEHAAYLEKIVLQQRTCMKIQ